MIRYEFNGVTKMEVKLVVDGKEVELNPFVSQVFFKVIEALISTLKGVNTDWGYAEVQIYKG